MLLLLTTSKGSSVLYEDKPNTYQFKLKLLGHDIFEIEFGSTASSNRFMAIGMLVTFVSLTIIGAYGEKFIQLYKLAIGG